MATNTCMSVLTYQTESDMYLEPFCGDREALADTMYSQGKTGSMPNWVEIGSDPTVAYRLWVDHAAAQEFIDFVVTTAPTYNVTLVSTGIQDL